MKIYLVRHAQKEGEGENPNLTRKGIKQAKFLSRRLKKIKFEDFYSSNTNRTIQTSEVVSNKIKMKFKIEPSLNEYLSRDIKENKLKWKKEELKRYNMMINFLNNKTKNPSSEINILIIAHGIANRLILSHFLKIPIEKTIPFRQDETNINILEYAPDYKNWRLTKLNDNSHLPEKLK